MVRALLRLYDFVFHRFFFLFTGPHLKMYGVRCIMSVKREADERQHTER